MLTPCRPVTALTLCRQAPGRVSIGVSRWYDSTREKPYVESGDRSQVCSFRGRLTTRPTGEVFNGEASDRTPSLYTLFLSHEARCCCCCLLVAGCLTSQQQASASQGRICKDNFTCCHTNRSCTSNYLTLSQYTDTGPTSPSTDNITPGAWQGSHWDANF